MRALTSRLLLTPLTLAVLATSAACLRSPTPETPSPAGIRVDFAETPDFDFVGGASGDWVTRPFTAEQKREIRRAADQVQGIMRGHFPTLPTQIRVSVVWVDRDLSSVAGTTGRADAPGEVRIELAISHPGGFRSQLPDFRHSLFHELHHLVRGWTIIENRFGPGIAIAAVNEGMAEVYAEEQTGEVIPSHEYPAEAEAWAREILQLPTDADYGAWMFEHPDGRLAVGYRTGRYIIHQAMARSGQSVLELSERSPDEILRMAGLR